MVETKTPIYQLGQVRYKYLDLANMSFASGDWNGCMGYINAFMETIEENTTEGKQITKEFDRIEHDRKTQIQKLDAEIQNLGYLEQKDIQNNGRERIEIEAIYDRKTICWTAALQHGLFYA